MSYDLVDLIDALSVSIIAVVALVTVWLHHVRALRAMKPLDQSLDGKTMGRLDAMDAIVQKTLELGTAAEKRLSAVEVGVETAAKDVNTLRSAFTLKQSVGK